MKKFFSSPGRIIACIVCAAVILILAGGLGAYAALSLTGAIAPKGNEVVLAETSATEEATSAAEAESDLLEEESSVLETGAYTSETESDASVTENNTSEAASTRISLDEAKAIALGQAGLSASEVTFVKAKMEKDDGLWSTRSSSSRDRRNMSVRSMP